MNLRELEYIVALDEERNLKRAAEKVSVTPSALTQKVMQLEKDVGIALFIRSRTGFTPTEAGTEYIDAARRILQIKKDTYNELHDMSNQQSGTLNVGIFPERGADIFSSIYPKFHDRYPDIRVNLVETSVFSQQKLIKNGSLDLGLMTLSDEQKSGDDYILISREEILLAIPEPYPLKADIKYDPGSRFPVISITDLRYEPFALMSDFSTLRFQQEKIFRQNHMEPQILFESSRQNSILDMVSCKLCCALVSEHYVHSRHAKNVRFFAIPEHPTWNIVACHKKGSYLTDAQKYLIKLFTDDQQKH